MKMQLKISLENSFSAELEELRRIAYPEVLAKDIFDAYSLYIVMRQDLQLVGTIRITSANHGVHNYWSDGYSPFPPNPKIAELTRGVLIAAMRGKGFFRLMMLETLISLPDMGFDTVAAAARLASPQMSLLHSLGFSKAGNTINYNKEGAGMIVQPFILGLTKKNCELICRAHKDFINIFCNKE